MRGEAHAAQAGTTPPEPDSTAPARKQPRRWLRLTLRLCAASLVLAAAALWVIAKNLDHPWLKTRLITKARAWTGLQLDYSGLELSFDGLRARELSVLSPPRFAGHAEAFASVKNLKVKARPWALLWGERSVPLLEAELLEIAIVRDPSGATTLSELRAMRPRPFAPDAPRTPLSRALSSLPNLTVERLEVREIAARWIELSDGGAHQYTSAAGLRLQGRIQTGTRGLAGSDLELDGGRLRIETSTGPRSGHAELPAAVHLWASEPAAVALEAVASIGAQDLAPGWALPRQLLELEARVQFDEGAGRTAVRVTTLNALDGAVSGRSASDIFDGAEPRVVTTGEIHIGLERLPFGPWGVGLEKAAIDVVADELSWDGARVGGSLSADGRVRSLELHRPELQARCGAATFSGMGRFDATGGSFRATLTADELDADGQGWAVGTDPIRIEIEGEVPDRERMDQIRGRARLEVAGVRGRSPRWGELTLAGASAGTLVELRSISPLSLASVATTLSFAELRFRRHALRRGSLEVTLEEPLAWAPDSTGAPRLSARGRLEQFAWADTRGALEELDVFAQRHAGGRYRLELGATLAHLDTWGRRLPGRIRTDLTTDVTPDAGLLRLITEVRDERGADVNLFIDAHFDRDLERLRYGAELSAQKLEGFAPLFAERASSSAVALGDVELRASASGDLGGVLQRGAGLAPQVSPRPLVTMLGSQQLEVALERLDYRGPLGALVIPDLDFELRSDHRAVGRGVASTRLSAGSIRVESRGNSIALEGVEQRLAAKFVLPADEGELDLRATLRLASAAQSWVPKYPVRDASSSSHLQVRRLRSFFLRDLQVENPAAGTQLRATGALELGPLRTERENIAERRALAFEGHLAQELAPLAKSGLVARGEGAIALPFRVESGGLLAYRASAELQARDVSLEHAKGAWSIQGLNGVVPIVQEFVLLPGGAVLSPAARSNPVADFRFFDVHPFLTHDSYLTADAIKLGTEELSSFAANARVAHSDFVIDQLQATLRGGQLSGRLAMTYRDEEPTLRLRLNATGVRSQEGDGILDANAALTFMPLAMTLDGKVQLVRASRAHVLDMLDVLDPFHEKLSANRVRRALGFGHPKFVRFQLRDGVVDTKVELGGLAKLVRIDEIKAIPVGPLLSRYVEPALSGWVERAPEFATAEEVSGESSP